MSHPVEVNAEMLTFRSCQISFWRAMPAIASSAPALLAKPPGNIDGAVNIVTLHRSVSADVGAAVPSN